MIDPSKDKFAYFKDNIQTAEDKDFDASQYYYHRDDFSGKSLGTSGVAGSNHMGLSAFHAMGSGLSNALDNDGSDGAPGQHGVFAGFNSSGMMSGPNSFLNASAGRGSLGGGLPVSHELHRMNSGGHLDAVMKGRALHSQVENKTPDMSEFPALGSRMNSLNLDADSDARSRAPPSEFVIQKEDFPALSTFGPSSGDKSGAIQEHELKRHSSFTSSASDGMAPQRSGPQTGNNTSIGSRSGGGIVGLASSTGGGGTTTAGSNSVSLSGGAFGQFHSARPPPPPVTPSNGQLDPSNKFGLLGMLHAVIRPSNDAKKSLAMGCDLTSLGLNLNSAEPLHPTFASPWSEGARTKEPQFALPLCYYNQPPVLKTTHLSKFHIETLFYIFYSMPKDVLQAYAAQELYGRDWRYHAELKIWLKRATPADTALLAATSNSSNPTSLGSASGASPSSGSIGASVGSIGSAPASGASTGSIGSGATLGPQFLYFDTAAWERRVFTGNIHSVSAGLMSEEDIRVKYSATS